jgi:hypothetical protein
MLKQFTQLDLSHSPARWCAYSLPSRARVGDILQSRAASRHCVDEVLRTTALQHLYCSGILCSFEHYLRFLACYSGLSECVEGFTTVTRIPFLESPPGLAKSKRSHPANWHSSARVYATLSFPLAYKSATTNEAKKGQRACPVTSAYRSTGSVLLRLSEFLPAAAFI